MEIVTANPQNTQPQVVSPVSEEELRSALCTIIRAIGEDPQREGLLETPDRIMRMYKEIFRGYDPARKPSITTFPNTARTTEMVFDSGDYYSMCEHHILPFFGRVSIAYIPKGQIVGLSKLARIVDICAHKLQVQERLTAEICRHIEQVLNPGGVIVVCHAQHLCMKMRGVEKQDAYTTTVHHSGLFSADPQLRAEALNLLK